MAPLAIDLFCGLELGESSFEPKHEHKEAGVAYLASRWLDDKSTWQIAKKAAPKDR